MSTRRKMNAKPNSTDFGLLTTEKLEDTNVKLELTKNFSLLELLAAFALLAFSSYYHSLGNSYIASCFVVSAGILLYDFFSTQLFPQYAMRRYLHYCAISAVLAVGILDFGIIGAMWFIPLASCCFFLMPFRMAVYLNIAYVSYICFTAFYFGDFVTSARIGAVLCLSSAMTALYASVVNAQRKALEQQAITDPLTGAFNRLHLQRELTRLIDLQQEGVESVIALIDINDFKEINTKHGHHGGDLALIQLAEITNALLKPGQVLYRHGGDEFLITYEDYPEEEARQSIAKIQAQLLRQNAVPISFSVGFAKTSEKANLEELLTACDQAMYADKRSAA